MSNSVLVLMSIYKGEKYIQSQMESLINQKGVNIDILIRIDNYNDSTKPIIERYSKNNDNIYYYEGKNVGYAKSFWNLIQYSSSKYDYYAFCDQDDIWEPEKLLHAVKKLKNYDSIPALYTSNVTSVNNNMEILNYNTFDCSRVLNKFEAFQKNMFPGCVYVFNNKAKSLLQKYDGFLESHDWATYAIINSLGKVVYDRNSYIKYRIHESNAIGHKNKLTAFFKKTKNFFKKNSCSRSNFAKSFYDTFSNSIPDGEFKKSIYELAYYKYDRRIKRKLLFNTNFKGIVFKIYVLLNKV